MIWQSCFRQRARIARCRQMVWSSEISGTLPSLAIDISSKMKQSLPIPIALVFEFDWKASQSQLKAR